MSQIESDFPPGLVSFLETRENGKSFMRGLFLAFISAFLFLGCATEMGQQFEKVKVGMDKDDVLEIMDSPQRTQRWKGMDRWTYIFYQQDNRIEKEVHFQEGKAAYVGDKYLPAVSAEEQDAINEASNKEVEALAAASAAARSAEVKKDYQDYEQRSKGEDTIRFVPSFEPVQ